MLGRNNWAENKGVRKEILTKSYKSSEQRERVKDTEKDFLEEAVSTSVFKGGEVLKQGSWEAGRRPRQRGWWEPTPGAENLRGFFEQRGVYFQ